jgi:hypothetical protein
METKDLEIIVTDRRAFLKLIREMFIPYLIQNNLIEYVDFFKKTGMFNDWTTFFYSGVNVVLNERK